MLRGVGEIAPDFPWSTYLFTLSQKAEITRGICASNMEHAYREQIGIEHVHISADEANISVDIISSGKTFQAHIDRRKPIEEQLVTQLGNTAQKVTLSLTSRGDDLLKD